MFDRLKRRADQIAGKIGAEDFCRGLYRLRQPAAAVISAVHASSPVSLDFLVLYRQWI